MKRLPNVPTLAHLARLTGTTAAALEQVHRHRSVHCLPGKLVDGERPLPLGSRVDMRRELPGTEKAARDKGWRVVGYTQSSAGRWSGYELAGDAEHQGEYAKLPKVEAFDLVERYEGLTTKGTTCKR